MLIKNSLKRRVYTGKKIDPNELFETISSYPNVSFDIFDTLVKRNIEEPFEVFLIMEKILGIGFKDERINAERRARYELEKKEVTIEDIYSYFPVSKRKELMELEIETELQIIVPNRPIVEVYNRCIQTGKTIFITSDMYWPEHIVKELLKKNGFDGYKTLYLSSAQQKLKSDGSLFKYLIDKEKITPHELIHIGDSFKGDYEEPKKIGIAAVRIPRYFKNTLFRDNERNCSIGLNYLNHYINNTLHDINDPYYKFGYTQFGKLLYGFVHWIHDESVKRGIKKIFFFARDGYIIKKAYEACIDDQFIETRYLEVSRRSLRGPILWMDCEYETILNMVVNAKLVSLRSVFDGLGLEIKDYKNAIERHGLLLSETFDRSTIKSDIRLKALIEDIKPAIIENSKKEYELLIRYLKENDVKGRFAVVDIGYGGSMQRYLQQVLTQIGIDYRITGFYLGVADFYTKNILPGMELDLNGYLFDFQHDPNAIDTRRSFVGLFETLFLEQGGSVKKYIEKETKVIAERYPYEYEVNGKPTEDLEKIRRIQGGALEFIKNAASDVMLERLRCKPEEYFLGLKTVGEDPSMAEVKLFGDISFYDEGMIEKLALPKKLVFYLVHPKQMKTDFLQSRWKIGFLKRLFLVKLPYQKIYERLRSMG